MAVGKIYIISNFLVFFQNGSWYGIWFDLYYCTKGQLISKCLFGVFNFFQKTNKNTSHSSKNEFIRLCFGRIYGLTICFQNQLTFSTSSGVLAQKYPRNQDRKSFEIGGHSTTVWIEFCHFDVLGFATFRKKELQNFGKSGNIWFIRGSQNKYLSLFWNSLSIKTYFCYKKIIAYFLFY